MGLLCCKSAEKYGVIDMAFAGGLVKWNVIYEPDDLISSICLIDPKPFFFNSLHASLKSSSLSVKEGLVIMPIFFFLKTILFKAYLMCFKLETL